MQLHQVFTDGFTSYFNYNTREQHHVALSQSVIPDVLLISRMLLALSTCTSQMLVQSGNRKFNWFNLVRWTGKLGHLL